MATCTSPLSNTSIDCLDPKASGGLKAVYYISSTDVTSFTASTTEHSYTAVTLSATSDVFYKGELKSQTGTATYEPEEGNGGVAYTLNVEFFMPRQEKEKAFSLQQQIEAGYLIVIAAYTNGEAFVYGYDEKLQNDAQLQCRPGGVLEAEFNGLNGYNVSYTGSQIDMPRQFIGTIDVSGGTTVTFS